MFGFTLPLLLTALYAGRIAAEVPASCQQDRNGFFVTEDTYLNKIVAFQVAFAPLSLNITDHYLSLDDPTPYPEIRNITTSLSPASAVHFTPIYQRASQSPKSGAWSCAWHKFVAPDTVYNRTTGGSATDVFLGTLNWDPSPLLMTSYGALKRDFKEAWTSVAYGWVVISNGAGDTRVIGTLVRSTFLAHRGDDGRVLVGHTDMAKVDEERGQAIELRMVVVGEKTGASLDRAIAI